MIMNLIVGKLVCEQLENNERKCSIKEVWLRLQVRLWKDTLESFRKNLIYPARKSTWVNCVSLSRFLLN